MEEPPFAPTSSHTGNQNSAIISNPTNVGRQVQQEYQPLQHSNVVQPPRPSTKSFQIMSVEQLPPPQQSSIEQKKAVRHRKVSVC